MPPGDGTADTLGEEVGGPQKVPFRDFMPPAFQRHSCADSADFTINQRVRVQTLLNTPPLPLAAFLLIHGSNAPLAGSPDIATKIRLHILANLITVRTA